jgi:hypothetical protein
MLSDSFVLHHRFGAVAWCFPVFRTNNMVSRFGPLLHQPKEAPGFSRCLVKGGEMFSLSLGRRCTKMNKGQKRNQTISQIVVFKPSPEIGCGSHLKVEN